MIYDLGFMILLIGAAYCAYKMSAMDLRERIIPDVYLWPFMLIGLVIITFFPWICSVSESVIASVFGYILSLGIGQIFKYKSKIRNKKSETPIGLGDIKLLSAAGIWLGITGLSIAIAISCIIAYIWGIRHKQKYVPYAPFLFVGGFFALIILWILI